MTVLLFLLPRLFSDDDHDDVEATFGSLSKKKEQESPVCISLLIKLVLKETASRYSVFSGPSLFQALCSWERKKGRAREKIRED